MTRVILIRVKVFNSEGRWESFGDSRTGSETSSYPPETSTHKEPSRHHPGVWRQAKQTQVVVVQDLTVSLTVPVYFRTLKHVIYKLLLSHSGKEHYMFKKLE